MPPEIKLSHLFYAAMAIQTIVILLLIYSIWRKRENFKLELKV